MSHVYDASWRSCQFIWQRRPSSSWGLLSSVWAVSYGGVTQWAKTRAAGQTYGLGLLGSGLLDLGFGLLDSSLDLDHLVSIYLNFPRQHGLR